MRKKNGFTLVELLAVIVVLAIIMVIAIPSVLDTMNSARRSAFIEYAMKVVRDTQNNYVTDSQTKIPGAGIYIYDIANDLGYTSHGNYEGYVVVNAKDDVDKPSYILFLHDPNYMVTNWNVTTSSYPTEDGLLVYDQAAASAVMGNPVKVCNTVTGDTTTPCMNRNNYVYSDQASGGETTE